MRKLQFFVALWAGKLFLWWYLRRGKRQNDRPGMVSMRLCGDFLKYVAKPQLTIAVTGTNGKTTVSSMVASILEAQGKSVSYNDWGANHHAGHARCLLDAVSIFNKPTKDAVVIEMDELISPINVPKLKPDYLIINNLARDSMLRNAHPGYIQDHLRQAVEAAQDTVVIVNADDPCCCFLGEHNRRVYFGMTDTRTNPMPTRVDDFSVCPKCGAKPVYKYRQYRHVGEFYCPRCGLKTPERDYFIQQVDYEGMTMQVREPDGIHGYPLVSKAIYNIYDVAAVIALFRDMGMPAEMLAQALGHVKVPASRETRQTVEGIELITQLAKGQNPTATSTVFENVYRDPRTKEIVLLLDEVFDDPHKSETIAWIYDSDYEFLGGDTVKKIIVGGERYLDHRVRLLLAGIPAERIVCVRDPFDTPQYVDTEGVEHIYVLHDVNFISRGHRIRDEIAAGIRESAAQKKEQHQPLTKPAQETRCCV